MLRAASLCELYPYLEETGLIDQLVPKKEAVTIAKWCVLRWQVLTSKRCSTAVPLLECASLWAAMLCSNIPSLALAHTNKHVTHHVHHHNATASLPHACYACGSIDASNSTRIHPFGGRPVNLQDICTVHMPHSDVHTAQRACSHGHIQLLLKDGQPIFFTTRDGPWCPTLRIVHQYPDMMKKLRVDQGAPKFVLAGANIMCPGLTSEGATIHDEVRHTADG